MEITIDVSQYLSEEEIKDCCKDAIKQSILEQYRGNESNINRLISLLNRQFVWDIVDSTINDDLESVIKDGVVKAISDLKTYHVFHQKDVWDNDDSVAYKILQKVCEESESLIRTRVEDIIKDYPFNELKSDEIGDVVYNCIMEKLFKK